VATSMLVAEQKVFTAGIGKHYDSPRNLANMVENFASFYSFPKILY